MNIPYPTKEEIKEQLKRDKKEVKEFLLCRNCIYIFYRMIDEMEGLLSKGLALDSNGTIYDQSDREFSGMCDVCLLNSGHLHYFKIYPDK